MLALGIEGTVHTSGVNWDQIIVIFTGLVVAMVAIATFIRGSVRNNRKVIAEQIDRSVKEVAQIMNIRFEEVDRRMNRIERDK